MHSNYESLGRSMFSSGLVFMTSWFPKEPRCHSCSSFFLLASIFDVGLHGCMLKQRMLNLRMSGNDLPLCVHSCPGNVLYIPLSGYCCTSSAGTPCLFPRLAYHWFIYKEPGYCSALKHGKIHVEIPVEAVCEFRILEAWQTPADMAQH